MHRATFALAILAFASAFCYSQDSQSLGDVARQVRAQKQQKASQSEDAPSKAGEDPKQQSSIPSEVSGSKAKHVITNDDSPGTQDRTPVISAKDDVSSRSLQSGANREEQGEHWKAEIQSQKELITSLQNEITQLSKSIRFTGANCVANCVKWNEHQERKQEQVETMKAQLEEQNHRLEEMQETARKQGFGSSVYDP